MSGGVGASIRHRLRGVFRRGQVEGERRLLEKMGDSIRLRDTVICHLSGGLANQMICYKLGRFIADTRRYSLLLDLGYYGQDWVPVNRNLQLLHFPIEFNGTIADANLVDRLRRTHAITSIAGKEFSDFHEPTVKQQAIEEVRSSERVVYCDLWGGLALREVSDRHAEAHGVRRHLVLDRASHFGNADYRFLAMIQRSASPVAIHVRRGDFEHHDGGLLLTSDYYNTAIKRMESELVAPDFFVFSDDIPWCRKNLRSGRPLHFADFNDERHAYKDLSLATACRHLILSNESTFSHQIWELCEARTEGLVIRSNQGCIEERKHE